MFFDVFLLFMIEFKTIISIMIQLLIIIAFDLFFKSVLLAFTFHHIRAHSRRLCGSPSEAIFFSLTAFVIIFFAFILKMILIFIFIFTIWKCFMLFGEVLDSFRFSFRLVVLIDCFFFDWFNLNGFIAQGTKISGNCVIHQLNINFLI